MWIESRILTFCSSIAMAKSFGRFIKPHGLEWKQTFQHLMLPFLNPYVFPNELISLLAKHFKNPKASSDTDVNLALALKNMDKL
jgi:SprT protein